MMFELVMFYVVFAVVVKFSKIKSFVVFTMEVGQMLLAFCGELDTVKELKRKISGVFRYISLTILCLYGLLLFINIIVTPTSADWILFNYTSVVIATIAGILDVAYKFIPRKRAHVVALILFGALFIMLYLSVASDGFRTTLLLEQNRLNSAMTFATMLMVIVPIYERFNRASRR